MGFLEKDIIIKSSILLIILLTLCIVNIYILVRHRRDFLKVCINISLSLCMSYLFCLLIDIVTISHPIDNGFIKTSKIFLTLTIISTILSSVYLLYNKIIKKSFWVMPDLSVVFGSIEYLMLVIDYRRKIVDVNRPEILEKLCSKVQSYEDICEALKIKSPSLYVSFLENEFFETTQNSQIEIHFDKENQHHLCCSYPIFNKKTKIGMILTVQNITDIKESETQYIAQNIYLEEANTKLLNYVKIASTLEAEKERLKYLEEIQVILINAIENNIIKIQQIQKNQYDNMTLLNEDILKITDSLRSIYKDVRISVKRISGKERGLI